MVIRYKKESILEKLEGIRTDQLYTLNCIKQKGTTLDTNEYNSEILAEGILKNRVVDGELNNIQRLNRQDYRTPDTNRTLKPSALREENATVIRWANEEGKDGKKGKEFKTIGKIIAYEVPLNERTKDVKGLNRKPIQYYGRIDFLTFDGKDTIYLVELKKKKSYKKPEETALRAILEIQTYYQALNLEKFREFCKEKILEKSGDKIEIKNIKIKKIVMFFEDSNPAKEIKDNERTELQKIKKLFDIKACILDKESEYII